MKVIRHYDSDYTKLLKQLNRHPTPDPGVSKTVAEVLQAVGTEGDAALVRFTEEFGGPSLRPAKLKLPFLSVLSASETSRQLR